MLTLFALGGTAMEPDSGSQPMADRDLRLGDEAHSCSTFMLRHGGDLLVGHNLDEYIDTPGLVVVNKRGVSKFSTSWAELTSDTCRPATTQDRLRWTSKYGSLTYTTRGRECIDGGMNEAGLYIGEMTLMGTQYPEVPNAPRMYQVLWMQYLLDCCATVSEVIARLGDVQLDGTCQWHFFVADRDANAAVIEFLEKRPIVHTGSALPIPLVCNAPYQAELDRLARYAGFGGDTPIDGAGEQDMRFVWGAQMLAAAERPSQSSLARAWEMLTRLQGESNRWGIIYEARRLRMYFRTNEAPEPRFADFASFDFSPSTPPLVLDINQNLAGDVASRFEPYTHARNREFIARFWDGVDGGEQFNTVLKPGMIDASARFIERLDAGQ
jgi:penicillin V acylase-like amidase (Ntn superfamily)